MLQRKKVPSFSFFRTTETWQKRVVWLKAERGISGGKDCKDTESPCLKSGFSGIYYFRISPNVLQCISVNFLDWARPKADDTPIQCSNVPFFECQEINFCIEIHSNYLAGFIQFDVQYICKKGLGSLQNSNTRFSSSLVSWIICALVTLRRHFGEGGISRDILHIQRWDEKGFLKSQPSGKFSTFPRFFWPNFFLNNFFQPSWHFAYFHSDMRKGFLNRIHTGNFQVR